MSQSVENPKFCVAKSKFVSFFYTTRRQNKVIDRVCGWVLPLPPSFLCFILLLLFLIWMNGIVPPEIHVKITFYLFPPAIYCYE